MTCWVLHCWCRGWKGGEGRCIFEIGSDCYRVNRAWESLWGGGIWFERLLGWVLCLREWVDLGRRFGGTSGNDGDQVVEGEVHRSRLWGNRVNNAVGCGLELWVQRWGSEDYEGESAGEEWGSACLMADLSGIDCWLRRGSCKIGMGRYGSQGEGMSLEAKTC